MDSLQILLTVKTQLQQVNVEDLETVIPQIIEKVNQQLNGLKKLSLPTEKQDSYIELLQSRCPD